MNFGEALRLLKAGRTVAREGWNGKGMWLVLMKIYTHTGLEVDGHGGYRMQPFIAMKTVDDTLVPWLASQTDLLAEDWRMVK